MTGFRAPLRDLRFVREELLDFAAHYAALPGCAAAEPDVVAAILEQSAQFCEEVLAPLYQSGDAEGCHFEQGQVRTPAGFAAAYRQFVALGMPSLAHPVEYGGQGLPPSLGMTVSELMAAANWPWAMYPGLAHGAMNTLEAHGSAQQKQVYLTKLVSGEWTGTMCLTEAHCGSDLGLLRTRAEPQADGSYRISGSKIFISAGEHDMAANIVHIVLARLPDAPAGSHGISLFIVPKFLPDAEGGVGARNALSCGGIEHKMGIHANATCVLNFDAATGFLLGPPNGGLHCMFTFMNMARLGTALQGLAHAERAWQGALRHARERQQGRALAGAKYPQLPADPLIVHADVRRMLLTIRALTEGSRALLHLALQQEDLQRHAPQPEQRAAADQLLGFLTPIAKAFITELGFECASLGVQVYGGHGYIREWGMEQNLRDSRIAMLYEGTTGIQALDLLGRKVLMSQGEALKLCSRRIQAFCQQHGEDPQLREFTGPLAALVREWHELLLKIGMQAMHDREEVGAAAVDFLMFSGYVCLAWLWADMARLAQQQLAAGSSETAFYRGKLVTARFYYQRILPRTRVHAAGIQAGAAGLLALADEEFSGEN